MINRDLIEIFIELAREKNIERSELGTIIEQLFLFIIEKETGESDNCSVIVNLDKGEIEIYVEKTIVEEVDDEIFPPFNDWRDEFHPDQAMAPDCEDGEISDNKSEDSTAETTSRRTNT